jgi:hypothetical protein
MTSAINRTANLSFLPAGRKLPVMRIAVGATALYDLQKGWDGEGGFNGWQSWRSTVKGLPDPGPAHPIVSEMLRLNKFSPDPSNPLVTVSVVSRLKPVHSSPIAKALRRDFEDAISSPAMRHASYGSGKLLIPRLQQLGIDFYLGGNPWSAQQVLSAGISAVHVLGADYQEKTDLLLRPILWKFDYDYVIGEGDGEVVYQHAKKELGPAEAIRAFEDHEKGLALVPNKPGPLIGAFLTACALRSVFDDFETSPFQIGIGTARGNAAAERVNTTLEKMGIYRYLDYLTDLGGDPKGPWAKAYDASFGLDDGPMHGKSYRDHGIPFGHVIDGPMNAALIAQLEQIPD